jgi:hypothetical protein
MRWPGKGYLGGQRSVLHALVRLGMLIPLFLFAGSILLLGIANVCIPQWKTPLLFTMMLVGLGYWGYASAAIFHCALNEQRNTWLGGALLFLVPFQALGVIRGLIGSTDAILGLVGR